MKIEFEIDEKESILLLDIIKRFMGQTGNPNALKTLSKIVKEIEGDLTVADEVFKRLRYRLIPYTNGNLITPDSDMKIYLGISENFLTRQGGLETEASKILKNIVETYKPEYDIRKLKKLPINKIKDCKKISDVVSLIQSQYESL